MDKLLTVVQVSRQLEVSARMLRHYEKMGLIRSRRVTDYAYRMYDAEAVERVRAILLLRKLRLSLKDIGVILMDGEHVLKLQTLRRNLASMDDEIASMQLIRDVLGTIVEKCQLRLPSYRLLDDEEAVRIIDSLVPAKNDLQEGTIMTNINEAEKTLTKPDVRVLLIPPYTVAAGRVVGCDPEEAVGNRMSAFVQQSGLYDRKPDARMFGFNSPNPGVLEEGIHGYEVWVTIPDDLPLPEGIEKKHMPGGLYAVMTISFPEFHRWQELLQWAEQDETYQPDDRGGPETMYGGLEEHLNWVYNAAQGWPKDHIEGRLDLMLPIQRR